MGRPSIGSYVSWPDGYGQVDLVVTRGAVPGVADAVASDPLARIQVWASTGEGWRPTEQKVAVPVGELVEVPYLGAPDRRVHDAATRLVSLVSTHQRHADHLGLPVWARPDGVAIKAVFERGRTSWPGSGVTAMTAEEWALGRVEAFLALASGAVLDGYRRDDDQLPLNHPARGRP